MSLQQLAGTALLLICILAITDVNSSTSTTGSTSGLLPLSVGMAVTLNGMCFAFNCGDPLNPARDFPARLFTALAGWGSSVFT